MRKIDKASRTHDEFYTTLDTVKRGIDPVKEALFGKSIYCNCDDYRKSNFVKYLNEQFDEFHLKELIATNYSEDSDAWKYVKRAEKKPYIRRLKGNGDFRSKECIEILKKSDVVITNPPFSLKKEILEIAAKHDKQVLMLLPQTTATVKEIGELIRSGKLWFGPGIKSGGTEFEIPEEYDFTAKQKRTLNGKNFVTFSGLKWFTNLDFPERHKEYKTGRRFEDGTYTKFDNFDAINIETIKTIPDNYNGIMGVPVTFITYLNPEQFEIVGFRKGYDNKDLRVGGKEVFPRYLVKRLA